jgi:hypothetical protein
MASMKFTEGFISDGDFGCLLWSEEPRVRFAITSVILEGVLGGTKSIVADRNVHLCKDNDDRIFAACCVAYDERPDKYVELRAGDFSIVR